MLSRIFKSILVFLVAYILLGYLYIYWTGDFSEENVVQEGPKIELSSAGVDIIPILSQPYHYLNKGNQTYAFISSDGKYVLKLFKKHTLKRTPFTNIIPAVFPWKALMQRSDKEEIEKRDRLFVGYRLAYDMDRDNTGLVYLSFGHSSLRLPNMTTIDNLDLNTVPFVIQLKAKITRQVLKEYLNRGDMDGLNEKIDQLYALYISEYKKGIVDNDHNVLDNTGFVDGRAIRLDVGKLVYDESYKNPEVYEKDLDKIKKRLQRLIPSI